MIGRSALSGRTQRLRPVPPSFRWYASTTKTGAKKDLPPPLPPRGSPPVVASSSSSSSSSKTTGGVSPAGAKKEYLEARKRTTGEFLKDPRANIARLQADMDRTKEKLARVHDKPIGRRILDRFGAKKHSVINLLAAALAYMLAHRLHLKMKANKELSESVEAEQSKNSELRSLLKSLTTEEFLREVVAQATATATAGDTNLESETKPKSSWWFGGVAADNNKHEHAATALIEALRQKLEAKIGDEGLGDEERKEKNIREILRENEQRIEERQSSLAGGGAGGGVDADEELSVLAAAIAAGVPIGEDVTASKGSSVRKQRVFDM